MEDVAIASLAFGLVDQLVNQNPEWIQNLK